MTMAVAQIAARLDIDAPVLKLRITSSTKQMSMVSSTANSGGDGCLMANPADQQEMRAVAIAPAVMIASHMALHTAPRILNDTNTR